MNTEINKELYIDPSFFSKLFGTNIINQIDNIEDKYSKGDYDQYTEIKKYNNSNISSKFEEIGTIPLSLNTIEYNADIWDFSVYKIVGIDHSKFDFSSINPEFKKTLKDDLLLRILKGNVKISTLWTYFTRVRTFVNYLYNNGITTITDIDAKDVDKFLKSIKDRATRTYLGYQSSIKDLLQMYDAENNTEILTSEIQELCKRIEFKELKAVCKNNKRKAIPEDYFDSLIQILIETMNDEKLSTSKRAQAAILLLDSQTGLRASELSLLEANSVETIKIDDIEYRMIHYKIIKTAKGNVGITEHITYINDLSYKAYLCLMDLYKENRKNRESNLLFCPANTKLPYNQSNYRDHLRDFCILNYKRIGSTNPFYKETLAGCINTKNYLRNSFKDRKKENTPLRDFSDINDETEFYFPVLHQFRNTVVNRLLNAGVQLEFIRRYMGHLSQEMTASYAGYNDNDMQENVAYSESVLRTYLKGDARILGNSGKQLMERIDEWLEKNELNVAKDMDEIVAKLLKLIPIRAKHGGMCMKGSRLTDACSVDSQTDEFFCACGVCPNICHFYFMIDVTYSDFKAALEIYEYNKKYESKFKRQIKKEFNKIRFLVLNRLQPELIELEKELELKGKEQIIMHHPELINIIANIETIKEEVAEWTSLTI